MKTQTVQLGEVCRFLYGRALKEENRRIGKVPVYGSNGVVGWHDEALTTGATIVIGRKGSIGEVNWSHGPCFPIDTTYYVEKADRPYDLRWLYYTLLKLGLTRLNKSAAIPGLNRDDAYEQRIPFPDVPKQERIAALLDQADRLVRTRRYALELTDAILPAVFVEMFGNPQVGTNDGVTLQEVADILTGYPFPSEEYVTSGARIRLCRGANVLPGRIDWSDLAAWSSSNVDDLHAFELQPGDVLVAMDRPWISEGFKVTQVRHEDCPSLLVQRVARIRGRNGVPNSYLYYLLRQPSFTLHCRPTETTIPHISPKEIQTFSFHLPDSMLQRKFANLEERVERLRPVQREALRQAEHLFQTLLHEAFGDHS